MRILSININYSFCKTPFRWFCDCYRLHTSSSSSYGFENNFCFINWLWVTDLYIILFSLPSFAKICFATTNHNYNRIEVFFALKFLFSKKATKANKIFTSNLTLWSKCQIYGEDFINFCGLQRKHEPYVSSQIQIGKICSLDP